MLKIKIPNIRKSEQTYVLYVLLGGFLGLDFKVETHESDHIEITRERNFINSLKLTLDNSFISKSKQYWLKDKSLPNIPLQSWIPSDDGIRVNLVERSIPILFGTPGFIKNDNHIHLNLDIFGSAFFMLSRYEELISKKRDNHDRFSAKDSISYKANFLDRPLIDEYTEILWSFLFMLWPDLKRKKYQSEIFISCDVDRPFDPSVETLNKMLKACIGDIIKRKNIAEMFKRINRCFFNSIGNYKFDRFYTFDHYMDLCEQKGLKAAFYFIPLSKESNNGSYEITDKKIINLIKKIDARGHEIGIHGSYQTFKDKKKILKQKFFFEEHMRKIGVNQKIKGNRQHYLRWESAVTPDYLDDAGFDYDTTGSYADYPGFRYGTSKTFSMWGWQSQKQLSLKQKPLIVMERSIANYMGLGYSKEFLEVMKDLKRKCKVFNGTFSLLWHNSQLYNKNEIILLDRILEN